MKEVVTCKREARRRLDAALYLLDGGYYPDVVNRSFYAVTAVADALLADAGIERASHEGRWYQFNRHGAHSGRIPRAVVALYGDLRELRADADYDYRSIEEAEARAAYESAVRFVGHVEKAT